MTRHTSLFLCLAALSAVPLRPVRAQQSPDTARSEALRVFLDCRSRFCDFDHFRREIAFVDYMRHRQDAQVHVLVTTRGTGGGGTEFTIALIGRLEFAGVGDSLVYYSRNTDTFDEVRRGLTRMLKLGLVRYVARLPLAERFDVAYTPPDTLEPTPQVVHDPWDFWIFRIRVGGNFGGEERQSSFSGNGSLSANRTTEDWKIRLYLNGWYDRDHFEFEDGSELTSISRDYGGGALTVASLGEHWSVGGLAEVRTSTFTNHDLALEAGPAVEYNIFPYSESTRRELTFIYAVELEYFDYKERTIFDKMYELRGSQTLEIEYSVEALWGTINTSLEATNFLSDWSQHRVDLGGWLNLRLVRGLELNLRGFVARTKNQIYLERGGASDEEVLLRRKDLGTDYRFWGGISISYTFGSIYNNVVNPRFQ